MPAPRIASLRASSRASARVATPETAAVRTAVIAPAFMIARVSPVTPSNSATKPWCESSPRAELPGKIATVFSAYSGAGADAVRRHQPEQARLVRAAARRSAAGCTARRARATRARRPSRRCTRPSAAAAGRRARRARVRSCEEAPRSCRVPLRRERQLLGRQHRLELLRARIGPQTAPADAGTGEHPREGERGEVDASRFGLARRAARARRRPRPRRTRSYGPGRCVMREPAGNASPRRYLPVSQPPASGPNGT